MLVCSWCTSVKQCQLPPAETLALQCWPFCSSLITILFEPSRHIAQTVNAENRYREIQKKKYKNLGALNQTLQRRCFIGHFLWKDYHFKQNRRKLVGSDYGDRKSESHETVNKVLFVLLYLVPCFAFPARNVRQGFSTRAGTKLFECLK